MRKSNIYQNIQIIKFWYCNDIKAYNCRDISPFIYVPVCKNLIAVCSFILFLIITVYYLRGRIRDGRDGLWEILAATFIGCWNGFRDSPIYIYYGFYLLWRVLWCSEYILLRQLSLPLWENGCMVSLICRYSGHSGLIIVRNFGRVII